MSLPGRRARMHPAGVGRQHPRRWGAACLLAAALSVSAAQGLWAQRADAGPSGGGVGDVSASFPGETEGLRELSLEEALGLARSQADAVKLERRSLLRASLALREARAGLGPELNLRAAGAYLANPPGFTVQQGALGSFTIPALPPVTVTIPDRDVVFRQITESTYFELNLELRQPLFTWLKLKSSVDLAQLAVGVSAADLEETQRRIRRQTAESYYVALLARETVPRLEDIARIVAEIEMDREEAYELGLTNLAELLEIQAQEAGIAQRLLQAREGYSTALDSLKFYSGLGTEGVRLTSRFPEPGLLPEEALLRRWGAEQSPALKKLRLQVDQARKNAVRLRGGGILKPDVALSVAVEITGQKPPWAGDGWEDSWNANVTVGLGAEGTLFDSGRSRWRIAQAEESVEGAAEALELGARQIELAVRQAVQEARVAQGRIAAVEAALRAKMEVEKNAREAFAQELLTRQQLGLARLDRLRSDLELESARCDFALALVRLEYLCGELPERGSIADRGMPADH